MGALSPQENQSPLREGARIISFLGEKVNGKKIPAAWGALQDWRASREKSGNTGRVGLLLDAFDKLREFRERPDAEFPVGVAPMVFDRSFAQAKPL